MQDKGILVAKELKGQYKGGFGVVYAVNGVSFEVIKGEVLGLAGESGCGKSTLMRLLTGVIDPPLYYSGGEVLILGKEGQYYSVYNLKEEELRKKVSGKLISYVPQSSFDALNPTQRIREFIADTLRENTGKKYSSKDIHEMLREHFDKLGLSEDVLDRYPHELSGGMKQRTVIAISAYLRPSILLLDEPTSALDVSSQKRLIELLVNLHKEGILETIIISSHDLSVLRQLCDRIGIMYAGKLIEIGDTDTIINDPLHPYTRGLLNSLPPLEKEIRYKKVVGIPGRAPELTSPLLNCSFYSRCPQAMEICSLKEPPVFENEGKHSVACWLCG
jgi:peptide/nickel transport system ATP-binding protein